MTGQGFSSPPICRKKYNKIIKKYPFEYRSLSYIVAALNVTSSEERGVTTAFMAGYEFNPIANPQEAIIEKSFTHLRYWPPIAKLQ